VTAPRVRIGITRWEDIPGERFEAYWERVREAGAQPVELSGPDTNVPALNGLILTGGLDVEPERYGEARHPKVKQTAPARDEFELALLEAALAADLPVLAICRGHQLLNVALGGRLLQHIEGDGHRADYGTEGYPSRWHTVRLAPGSRLSELLGTEEAEVNSRHHQAVTADRLSSQLIATARTGDIVEAVEGRHHRWVLSVQWHPERPEMRPAADPLFAAFVAACRGPHFPAGHPLTGGTGFSLSG
jgi:putative glutamine amidotransferase